MRLIKVFFAFSYTLVIVGRLAFAPQLKLPLLSIARGFNILCACRHDWPQFVHAYASHRRHRFSDAFASVEVLLIMIDDGIGGYFEV